jgi:hypothetical protein
MDTADGYGNTFLDSHICHLVGHCAAGLFNIPLTSPWRHPDFGVLLQLLLPSVKQDVRLATWHNGSSAGKA